MERARDLLAVANRIVSFLLSVGLTLSASQVLAAGDDMAMTLRPNVVRIQAETGDGFGFIVGERNGFLYIATADHIFRPVGQAGSIDTSPMVWFYGDGRGYKAELLEVEFGVNKGDLTVVSVKSPPGINWRKNVASEAEPRRGVPVWFVGLLGEWRVPVEPGKIAEVEPVGSIIVEGLKVARGTSGAPLISENGIVGMIIEDSGDVGVGDTKATPIAVIKRAFNQWNLPWQLGEPTGLELDAPARHPETTRTRLAYFTLTSPPQEIKPGVRKFTRTAPDRWVQVYPDGSKQNLNTLGRINANGCDGSVLIGPPEHDFQSFIPDKGCPNMTLMFRRLPSRDWIPYVSMDNIR